MSNHPDTVSESEAAEMLGWSPAALRSHRLRYEAQQTADALPEALREVLRRWPSNETRVLFTSDADALDGLIVATETANTFALTRQGAEVARRVRRGPRNSPCAEPPPALRLGKPPRVRYDRQAVLDWKAQHPEVANQQRRAARTVSQQEAAALLGISVGTLRGSRSKATRARARIEAGEARPGDDREAKSSPPWVWVGSEKRYRLSDLRSWMKRHAPQPDPLEVPRRRGELLDDEALADMAGISPVVLPGYRSRARKAYRAMLKEDGGEDAARRARDSGELAAPPHCRVDGQLRYHATDARAWVRRRNSR